ncbi:hypothetical protein M9H77_17370 [Catharanthus roseus]|uniref:Uncharacterized protein n=1 Tax=Catharanthus roseus TaxID=4058 RepID=A0ACC0B4E1_CATRO|nr:hypothetical protein M9H77_17370 [Catharanthus roseus]
MSTQGYHDMSAHNPYPFYEGGFQGRPQARGYYRPYEEVPRYEAWRKDNLFEDFGEDPNIDQAYHGGYHGNQQGDKTLDKIKNEEDCRDDLVDKEEGNEDQEINSFEVIEEGMSSVTIRALSNKVFEEEKMRGKERLETGKQKKNIEEGKRVDERKVSVEKAREEKLSRDKKMSYQKNDIGKREKRCFNAKDSEIIEAFEKEEKVLLLYCEVKIIEEYKDVFPEEHQVDLVPGAVIPNRSAYRSSPEETKEVRRQVEDLLSKRSFKEGGDPWKAVESKVTIKVDLHQVARFSSAMRIFFPLSFLTHWGT